MPVTSSAAAAAAPPAAAAAAAADASNADPSYDRPGPTATDGTNHSIMESPRRVTMSPEERKAKRQCTLEVISEFLGDNGLAASTSDPVIGLDVGGRVFYTNRSTLTTSSSYFAARFNGPFNAGRSHTDASGRDVFFLDSDPDLFRHVLAFLRRGVASWPKREEDPVLYNQLIAEADYFGIELMMKHLLPPVDLSSYLFQVDLVFYEKVEGDDWQRGEEIGVVSNIFRDVEFGEKEDHQTFIAFGMKGLGVEEELSRLCPSPRLDMLTLKVTIFDKTTGKEGLLYSGRLDGGWERAWAFVGLDFDTTQPDYGSGYDLSSFVTLRCGCCDHPTGDDPTVLDAGRPCNECCPCDGPCSCSWDMTAELHLVDFNSDAGYLNATQHLRFIQDHVQFK